MATIALVDDHVLLRNGLAALLRELDHQVVIEADNGKMFIQKVSSGVTPELVLLDINMPQMDGFETAGWIKKNLYEAKVLALSMYDDEESVMRMIRSGARGYILKDSEPAELKKAIHDVLAKGFYYSEMVTGKLIYSINNDNEQNKKITGLSEKELEFLKLASSEMTYKEIADKLNVSPRTVDSYRDSLFEKLDVKSRVGLVLFAIKNGIVKV